MECKRKVGFCPKEEECGNCFSRSFAVHTRSKDWSSKNEKAACEVALNTHKKIWFKCDVCSHEFDATPHNVNSRNSWCPYCRNRKKCDDNCGLCNSKSFAVHEKAKYWLFGMNDKKPNQVAYMSEYFAWFWCPDCSHSFGTKVVYVTSDGCFCPYCSSNAMCSPEKDCGRCYKKSFAMNPKSKFWSKKNTYSPREVSRASHSVAWFICHMCRKEFKSSLKSISIGNWCPVCKHKTEKKLLEFLETKYKSVIFQPKFSWCKNPETGRILPFDFCVGNVIVELDGDQHFKEVKYWKTCPAKIQERDRLKEKLAEENGYKVVRMIQNDVWRDKGDWKSLMVRKISGNS